MMIYGGKKNIKKKKKQAEEQFILFVYTIYIDIVISSFLLFDDDLGSC